MKLFDAGWAPSPRRVRIFLAEKGVEVETVSIDLRTDEQLAPAYLAVNPRGTVPTLLLDNGMVIDESTAICRYFEAVHPEPNLFGQTPVEIALIEGWTRRIESECYAAVENVFRNTLPALRDRALPGKWPPMPQLPELVTRGRIMFDQFVAAADARLGASAYLARDRFSYADIALVVALDFGRRAGLVPGETRANLARWYSEVSARPSMAA